LIINIWVSITPFYSFKVIDLCGMPSTFYTWKAISLPVKIANMHFGMKFSLYTVYQRVLKPGQLLHHN
jgi:hypothetical protein